MKLSDWIDSIAGSVGASVAAGTAITQGFSTPISYIAGRTIHGGLDIRGKSGTPVRAVVGGKVSLSKLNGGWGENVIVETDDGYFHWFAHFTKRLVAVGQRVEAGEVLGTLGTTGYSTGPHLHFEVRAKGGKLMDPFALYGNGTPAAGWSPDIEQSIAFAELVRRKIYTSATPKTQERYENAVIVYRTLANIGELEHTPDAEQKAAFERMIAKGAFTATSPRTRDRYELAVILERRIP